MNNIRHIASEALQNNDYRRVIHTGDFSQLVLMSIPPRGDIGRETHYNVDQMICVVAGNCVATLGEESESLWGGGLIIVPAGTEHNVVNTGGSALKLYTIYSPKNHIDGVVHHTKADAERDLLDKTVGETMMPYFRMGELVP